MFTCFLLGIAPVTGQWSTFSNVPGRPFRRTTCRGGGSVSDTRPVRFECAVTCRDEVLQDGFDVETRIARIMSESQPRVALDPPSNSLEQKNLVLAQKGSLQQKLTLRDAT